MPGMATAAQLDELRAATGVEAERIFLRLMIAHHEGGVAMANAAVADARTTEVRTLAAAIAAAQTSGDRPASGHARRPVLTAAHGTGPDGGPVLTEAPRPRTPTSTAHPGPSGSRRTFWASTS